MGREAAMSEATIQASQEGDCSPTAERIVRTPHPVISIQLGGIRSFTE